MNFTRVKYKDKSILMAPAKEDKTVDSKDYQIKLLNVSQYDSVGVLFTLMYNSILSCWPTEPIV